MKKFFACLCFICAAGNAMGTTYLNWVAANESWRRGYVFAYADTLGIANSADPDEVKNAKSFINCLKGFSDQAMLKVVEDFMMKNPGSKTHPMAIVVDGALRQLCKR